MIWGSLRLLTVFSLITTFVFPAQLWSAPADSTRIQAKQVQLKQGSRFKLELAEQQASEIIGAVMGEMFDAVQRLEAHAERRAQELGPVDFAKAVESGSIFLQESGRWKGEVTTIDEKLAYRIVHEPTAIAFLFHDAEAQSQHLLKYIGRQHVDAGSRRTDGQKGRDLVLIRRSTVDPNDPSIEYAPRKDEARRWRDSFKDWWHASYVKPEKRDLIVAAYSVGLQLGFLWGLSEINQLIHPAKEVMWEPMLLSGIFGAVFGTFNAFNKNVVQRGSDTWKTLKQTGISLAFSYTLAGMMGESMTITEVDGALTHLYLLLNNFLQNGTKTRVFDLYNFREELRVNLESSIALPKFLSKAKVKWQALEYQTIYLIPFAFKMLDLTGFSTNIGGQEIAIGKLALILSLPLASLAAYFYAKNYIKRKKAELAEDGKLEDAERLAQKFEQRWQRENPLNWLGMGVEALRNGSFQFLRVANELMMGDITSLRAAATRLKQAVSREKPKLTNPDCASRF